MIYLFGTPGRPCGACVESWHTVKLWRRFGLDVTVIPTGPLDEYAEKLLAIGVTIHPGKLAEVCLEDAVVVAFCNHPFLRLGAERLRATGCRIVWLNCMNQIRTQERELLERMGPFDAYVFQSCHQRLELQGLYEAAGARNFHRIPGAFDVDEFPFQPKAHRPDTPFVVGRLSRAHRLKYSRHLWDTYAQIPQVRARVMGWSGTVQARCGKPPSWAEVLPVGAEPALDFLRSLHALVHPGGEAIENWPRYVLEAMAAGVPVVTDASGGIPEMIRNGLDGFSCNTAAMMGVTARAMADNETLRMRIASRARTRVENDLAEPHAIFALWQKLFSSLS